MVKIKIEDIVFWILILFAIAIMIWMLSGSPTTESALIAIGGTILSSEILLWKEFFRLDKRFAISFIKLRNELKENNLTINNKIDNNNLQINNRFDNIENKLNLIIKRK